MEAWNTSPPPHTFQAYHNFALQWPSPLEKVDPHPFQVVNPFCDPSFILSLFWRMSNGHLSPAHSKQPPETPLLSESPKLCNGLQDLFLSPSLTYQGATLLSSWQVIWSFVEPSIMMAWHNLKQKLNFLGSSPSIMPYLESIAIFFATSLRFGPLWRKKIQTMERLRDREEAYSVSIIACHLSDLYWSDSLLYASDWQSIGKINFFKELSEFHSHLSVRKGRAHWLRLIIYTIQSTLSFNIHYRGGA